jgi:hypothetical protein
MDINKHAIQNIKLIYCYQIMRIEYLILTLFIIIIVILMLYNKENPKEKLGMTQFPESPTCKMCGFYTCGNKCQSGQKVQLMQIQNLMDGNCTCGSLSSFCNIPPQWSNIQCEASNLYKDVNIPSVYHPDISLLPKITSDMKIHGFGDKHDLKEDHIEDFIKNGFTLLVAKDSLALRVLYETLIYQTLIGEKEGFPDLYYIPGAVLVIQPQNDSIHYMIDYPIKYTAEKFQNYVNRTNNSYDLLNIVRRSLQLIPDHGLFLVIK